MKWIYFLLLFVGQCYEADCVSFVKDVSRKALSAQDKLELKNVYNFDTQFILWKKGLTKQQRQYLDDLFVVYEDLYRQYKIHPSSEREYELMMQMIANLKHIMEHWDSFYKDYSEVQMFDKSVQAWKKSLTMQQYAKVKIRLSIYKTLYNRYEATPTDTKCLQDLLKHQKVIAVLMKK